jgi:gluconolactonase
MKLTTTLYAIMSCLAATASAQQPSSAFDRGQSQQSWQNPGLSAAVAECQTPPPAFGIGGDQSADAPAPPAPSLPVVEGIPGVVAAGESWEVVWAWEGNNADGPMAGDNGTMIFANNDASNVMQLDPETGLATIIHNDTNTGGAVSRSKNGALFLAARGLNGGIMQLEPERRMLANSYNGEPFDCIGGVANDLTADSQGGVYLAISGGGLFYANAEGVMTQYGEGMGGANGIILSPDEQTLYATSGPVVMAFDVQSDGSLTNQREFGQLSGGGDGSAIDAEGRLYVAAGSSANVFSPEGELLGIIPGPQGMHGVAFGGRDKKTLFGIIFYGPWGTAGARNQLVALPMISQGYMGRAK